MQMFSVVFSHERTTFSVRAGLRDAFSISFEATALQGVETAITPYPVILILTMNIAWMHGRRIGYCLPVRPRGCVPMLLLVAILLSVSNVAAAHGREGYCSIESRLMSAKFYRCPEIQSNKIVGTHLVTDCLEECPGFRSTDTDHGICFKRQLFNFHNTNEDDYVNHYHHLWRDLWGALLWITVASFATAGGVSGGGIYVVLGVLVLSFAPKQASGLAQASNFGAGLGALFLNLKNRYPKTNIRNEPGEKQANGKFLHPKDDETVYYEKGGRRKRYTGKYYTRPLVNYDLALFLAPLIMGGAVLGVIVQLVLPNWLYLLIAAVVMTFTTYKTVLKYHCLHKQEVLKRSRHIPREIEILGADVVTADQTEDTSQDANDIQEVDAEFAKSPKDTHGIQTFCPRLEDEACRTPYETNELARDTPPVESNAILPGSELRSDVENVLTVLPPNDSKKPVTMLDDRSLLSGLTKTVIDKEFVLRDQYLAEDMEQIPCRKIRALFLLWVGLAVFTLLDGGRGTGWSGLDLSCGTALHGVMIGCKFGWLFGFSFFHGRKLLLHQKERIAVSYPFLPEDIMWDAPSLRNCGILTFCAGVVAGLIGSGGGTLLGPLLLYRGIHPRVTSATTATLIVLTSSSIAIKVVAAGVIHWSYALFLFTLCFVGSMTGKHLIDGYVQKTGRPSILVLILAILVALVTVGVITIIFLDISANSWCLEGFSDFCMAA